MDSKRALENIIECVKSCALELREAMQTSSTDYLSSTNESGDMQLGIDVRADEMIQKRLLALECVSGICSEEQPKAIYKKASILDSAKLDSSGLDSTKNNSALESSDSLDSPTKGLLVAYDPLDGSSLFDSNLSIGSIFGIYESSFSAQKLVASAYVVYGPRLEIVYAFKAENRVNHIVYDGSKWIEKGALKLGNKGKINAPGGTQKYWDNRHRELINSLFLDGYRLRYSGGMVPDLHQILCKGGGLFSYPATSDAPQGKLRKLFEVFPFALIYECANGKAINGKKRLLELGCKSFHESTPCFLGSKEEIQKVLAN